MAERMVSNNRKESIGKTAEKFNQMAQKNEEALKKNPFSDQYSVQKYEKNSTEYGKAPEGTQTEARAIKASVHICKEILFLMETINENAVGEPPNRVILFGKLFQLYSYYSESLMGFLIRARKYGLLTFEGEMLFQRQDDMKPVVMLLSLAEIRERLRPTGDARNCVTMLDKK